MLRLHTYQHDFSEPKQNLFWCSIGDAFVSLGKRQEAAPSDADKDPTNGNEVLAGLTMA